MPQLRIAIAGATGYTGEELLRLLSVHSHVRVTYLAASAKWERQVPVCDVFPRFARQVDLSIEALDRARLIQSADAVFLALPHGAAMDLAPSLLQAGKRIIDLSADFRLRDAAAYPRWYQFPHTHPELLAGSDVAYGLPEYHRDAIVKARLVANPGCYPTSVLLGALPLLKAGLVTDSRLIVDAKSGLSGAGRKADASLLFSEMSENLRAYKVNQHQHMPEMLQELGELGGGPVTLSFVPQVIPAHRGLVSMIHVRSRGPLEKIVEAYRSAYTPERAPFVRIRAPGVLPQLRDVVGTNYCDIGFVFTPETESLVVVSAIDNLLKGASGQAVQNLNLMMGWPEATGLR